MQPSIKMRTRSHVQRRGSRSIQSIIDQTRTRSLAHRATLPHGTFVPVKIAALNCTDSPSSPEPNVLKIRRRYDLKYSLLRNNRRRFFVMTTNGPRLLWLVIHGRRSASVMSKAGYPLDSAFDWRRFRK
jgi:hypothetical protein